jgi:glucose-6-phosphate-specific signal transduction histidine kinase
MLAVSDDGIGIDPAAASTAPLRGHIGLASSTERVEAIGGTLTTGPGIGGHGTRVVARLPAPAAEVRPLVIRSDDDASTAASVARPVAGSGD